MHISFKRVASLFLSAVLAIAVLAACSGGGESGTTAEGTTHTPTSGNSEPTKFSFFFIPASSKVVNSMSEMKGMKEIMKRTNSEIKFLEVSGGGQAYNEQFNIMLASGNYPDVIYWRTDDYPGGASKLLEDGVAIPLNDLIEKHAPNYKKLLKENPELRKQAMLDDGTIVLFPKIELDLRRMSYGGLMIRQDWLDKVDLPVPKTIDEWYTTLKAFKEQDPNGNGQPDEIPLTGDKGMAFIHAFSGAFGVKSDKFYLHPTTGKMTWGPLNPEFKVFVETIAKWYQEGLIDPEFASMDSKALDARIATDLSGASRAAASWFAKWDHMKKGKNPDFRIVGVPFPSGPAGKAYGIEDALVAHATGEGAFITSSAKHPEKIVEVLDFMYGPEGHDLLNWGIKGVSYEVVGGKKQYTDRIMKNPEGLTAGEYIRKYAYPTNGFTKVMDVESYKQIQLTTKEGLDALDTWYQVDKSLLLPSLSLGDDSQRFAQIMSEVKPYYDENFVKFIMGVEPMSNFDQFVKTLKQMGAEEAVKIQQAAYDRYLARQ